MVTFGEVARNVKNVIDRETCDLDRYIAGEHMKTDDLHIRKWGTINGDYLGPAFHCKFEKGQILYGSRRTYLRKVAIAPFDGICANTTFVIEPKGDAMIPEILPFLMQSEGFNQYSIQHSKGSTNPYIIWRDLAAYTFPLPPIDEQRRIAKILWAAEDVIVKNEAFVAEVEHYKQLMMRDLFSKGIGHEEFLEENGIGAVPVEWNVKKFGDCVDLITGYPFKSELFQETPPGIKLVRGDNITRGELRWGEKTRFWLDITPDIEKFLLSVNDILISMDGSLVGRNYVKITDGDLPLLLVQRVARIRSRAALSQEFAYQLLQTNRFLKYVDSVKTVTAIPHISASDIKNFIIPLPPLGEQQQIASILSAIDSTLTSARGSVEASKALKMRLINQLLSPPIGDGS